MNASSYADKLKNLINDTNKFNKCPSNQSDKVKRKINKIAAEFKDRNETLHNTLKRKGTFCNGHLYGLPKIHKCREDPPVRPIVSMSGTVTHDVAQYLNNIIRPYIKNNFMLNSTDELLVHLERINLQPNQQLCSLDVE